ncbi:MAG: lipopolysaccharide heptosyltransferase II [Candidatus Omnitrophica bacterium]|nr:lipopolysaccharide heptosyltransferase II [Candidatus Omnitrophota bacterium]
MRVLQLLPSLEVGGVERGVIDLAKGMKQRGESIVVISSGGQLVAELQKMGIPHYALPVHRKSLFSLSLVPKIAEVIRRERIDIIHARSRVPAWLGWIAARMTGIPFVTTCHGYYSTHLLSHVMGWGKRVIVISRIIGRHMIDHFGVPPDRIRLVHRGVNLTQFPFRLPNELKKRDLRSNPFRIVNIGRFSPIKGQVDFIKAVHLLKQKFPYLEVWLIGSEGKGKKKYTELVKKTIHQLGMESCVKLMGTRRDIPDILAKADLLVLSTLVPEAFGRVIIEAGAIGVPVVATGVGGVLDILEDGQNGFLVSPKDIEGMAHAMGEVLRDPERAKNFAIKLREKVEKEFSLEQMTKKTLEVYQEIKKQEKILIIKLGAVGDLILGVPSFRMIRERFPHAFISLLVDRDLAPLISSCPYLNEVIPVDRKKLNQFSYLLRVAKKLRQEGFDRSVDLQNSKWTHLLAFFSGIAKRYGFRRGKFGFLVNRPDHGFDVVESPVKHQFRILSKLGISELDEKLELWPDPESERKIEEVLPRGRVSNVPYRIGLVLGSSNKWPTKRWPLSSYYELSKNLMNRWPCQIFLIGTETDIDWRSVFRDIDQNRVMDMMGKTSLKDLVSLISRLDVLVTGDTAPLHVASAVRTRVVALFGPTDPKRHVPNTQGITVLYRSLACQPCYRGECHHEEKLACLNHISAHEVMDAVTRHLESLKAECCL